MLTSLSLLLAAACLVAAAPKLTGHARMRASAARFGIAWQRYQLIGVAELLAAGGVLAGLASRPLGVAAGLCFAVLLVGALFMHVRAGDSPREMLPSVLVLVIDAAYLAVAVRS